MQLPEVCNEFFARPWIARDDDLWCIYKNVQSNLSSLFLDLLNLKGKLEKASEPNSTDTEQVTRYKQPKDCKPKYM